MILVDTGVWIDFFAGRGVPHVQALEHLIQTDADLCICGVILTEVLQGIANDCVIAATALHYQCCLSNIYYPPNPIKLRRQLALNLLQIRHDNAFVRCHFTIAQHRAQEYHML